MLTMPTVRPLLQRHAEGQAEGGTRAGHDLCVYKCVCVCVCVCARCPCLRDSCVHLCMHADKKLQTTKSLNPLEL